MKKKAVNDIARVLVTVAALVLVLEYVSVSFLPLPGTMRLLITGAAAVLMLMVYTPPTYPPNLGAQQALQTGNGITVRRVIVPSWLTGYYAFMPEDAGAKKGFILYPGGFVDPRSYAPVARAVAEQGFLTVIVGMPFDLASFGYARALKIIDRYPDVKKWVIAGHSLGAWMACRFARTYRHRVSGVVLWGSCPSQKYRLDDTGLNVLYIHGTNDGIVPPEKAQRLRPNLPSDTTWITVDGGNHTQFGCYGDGMQRFDKKADLTVHEQQKIIVDATVDFMKAC